MEKKEHQSKPNSLSVQTEPIVIPKNVLAAMQAIAEEVDTDTWFLSAEKPEFLCPKAERNHGPIVTALLREGAPSEFIRVYKAISKLGPLQQGSEEAKAFVKAIELVCECRIWSRALTTNEIPDAIISFQQKYGLPATGNIDAETKKFMQQVLTVKALRDKYVELRELFRETVVSEVAQEKQVS